MTTSEIAAYPVDAQMRHPLAHRSGAHLMGWLITAFREWEALTRAQRTALLSPDPSSAHVRVRAALRERGLTDEADALTPWGRWVVHSREPERFRGQFAVTETGQLAYVDWSAPTRAGETC